MTLAEERTILDALFATIDHVGILHLSGGGEPFLHPKIADMIDLAFEYAGQFDKLMVFTNSTVKVSDDFLCAMKRCGDKLIVHASDYGIMPERTAEVYRTLEENGINYRTVKYYGDSQDFGGWVNFGHWAARSRTSGEAAEVFKNCAVTRDMRGNWRTRDGKVHWCSRSQRGMELGLIPDNPGNYVDLFDQSESRDVKRAKFDRISKTAFLMACDYCSGDQGTQDAEKRFAAAEQIYADRGR
jgi:hypothetical protein